MNFLNSFFSYYQFICFNRHLHLELCQLARELNAMFEIQMTMEMATYLVCLTRLLRYIFLCIMKEDIFTSTILNSIDISFWIFLYVARLFCLNYVCESVSTKVIPYIIYNMYICLFVYLFIGNYLF